MVHVKTSQPTQKLEALITDEVGLVPGSQKWMDNWTERVDKILAGDDEVKGCLIPLEVVDAILKADDSAPSDQCRL